MKAPLSLIALLALTSPALAQSDLDRMEAATVAGGQNLEAYLTSAVPELASVMPDWTWDARMRTAAQCTLDAIQAEAGDAAVAQYLTELEAFATTPITSMDQMASATPVPVSAQFAMQTGQTCGTVQIAMERMQASGFMEAMMQPEIMGRLLQ